MKKTPPLLPALALTALAGAAVFLTMTAPSCDPQVAEGRAIARPAAQARAFSAAADTPATADSDFRALAAAHVGPNTLSGFANTARVRLARRRFLMQASFWEPGETAQQIAVQARQYREARRQWLAWVLGSRTGLTELPGKLTAARTALDRACADRSTLTKDAQKTWDEWEAKNWRGYEPDPFELAAAAERREDPGFPGLALSLKTENDDPPPESLPARDFRVRRDELALPLITQLGELQDDSYAAPPPLVLFNSAAPETEETPAQAAESHRQSELASHLRGQLDELMSQSRLLAGRWQDRGWKGYVLEAESSNTLPEPPREPPQEH